MSRLHDTQQLLRPQKDLHRITWAFEDGVEFFRSHGEWIDLLHSSGFEVERLVELYAPDGAKTHEYYDGATAEWASKWPAEDLWAARKTRLTLASTSPQRRAILEQLRIPFEALAPDYVEHDPPDADPMELVRRHAEGKARSVHADGTDHARRRHDRRPRRTRLREGDRCRRRGADAARTRRPDAHGRLRPVPARRAETT